MIWVVWLKRRVGVTGRVAVAGRRREAGARSSRVERRRARLMAVVVMRLVGAVVVVNSARDPLSSSSWVARKFRLESWGEVGRK
jgi:hypothetical protein